MTYNGSFNYSEEDMQTLYARHKFNGIDSFDNFDGFRHSVISLLDDSYSFLFNVFLKNDRFYHVFSAALDEDERVLMAGMARFLGLDPADYEWDGIVAATPDICLSVESGCMSLKTFDKSSDYLFDLTDWAFQHYRENFTVEEFQALSEDEQSLFLKLHGLHSTADMTKEDFRRMHQRLVFGLHIPQTLKDYHQECAKELGVRIMTNPILADTIDTFLKRKSVLNADQLYFEGDKDKRFFVSLLMKEMADIWRIPEPVEDEYYQAPEIDKKGKEFTTFMQATYLAANDKDESKIGLVFRINAHGGYLTEGHENLYTVSSLAHEFGHLISNFLVFGSAHEPWLNDDKKAALLMDSPVTHIDGAHERFLQNNTLDRYYGAVKADFGGLPVMAGKHAYKGQYEERHADYVGETVRNMVAFSLKNKKAIRSFPKAKQSLLLDACRFMTDNKVFARDEDTYLKMQQYILKSRNYEELHHACYSFISDMADWIEASMEKELNENIFFARIRKPFIEKRGQTFVLGLEDFTQNIQLFFDMRSRILDMDYNNAPCAEKSLSCA